MERVPLQPCRSAGRAAVVALLAVAAQASAADAASSARPAVVVTDPVIAFANSEDDDHDPDCRWNAELPAYLAKQSEGRVVIAAGGDDRPRLRLVTQTLHVAGGGMWSGPKWLVVNGTLTDHGKLVGSFEARRQTIRGSLRGCTTIRELGEAVADDIVEWLAAPTLDAKLGDAK